MDELLIKYLYKNLVNNVNNVTNDKFKYLLNKGIDLLVEEKHLLVLAKYSVVNQKSQQHFATK